jgi:hypothetical protein
LNSSFRVENRRAKPKIIKNINNVCNIFIMPNTIANNSITGSAEKKKRNQLNKSK